MTFGIFLLIVVGVAFAAWVLTKEEKTWDELYKAKAEEDREYAEWRKARLKKFPDAPFVDISYQRFCDERDDKNARC